MTKVPLSSSGLKPTQVQAAIEVLTSGNLTMGSKVLAFESAMKVKAYLGVREFVMVNSGSSANLAMIEACLRPSNNRPWFRPGDGVIVPAIAWPTTVWPLIQLGLKPVFVDIDPDTLGLDLSKLTSALERQSSGTIKGIFVINPLGKALDEHELESISKRFGLTLLFDNCEALGAKFRNLPAGSKGLARSYSFYFSHHITTMEGGGIATDDAELADDLRSIRSHGWSRDRSDSKMWEEYGEPENSKFLFATTGFNIRPMEIQAAVGISQVSEIETYVERRNAIAAKVAEEIFGTSLEVVGFSSSLKSVETGSVHSWMLIPLKVTGLDAKARKKRILSFLSECDIETRPILTGNFLSQPAIRRLFPEMPEPEEFPIATEVTDSYFMVGCHHDFSDEQVNHLARSLQLAAQVI